jgi:hypothetical protein
MAVLAGASADYSVLARAPSDAAGEFVAHFPLGKAWDSLPSGQYEVVLFVSDDKVKEAKKWVAGTVSLSFDPKVCFLHPMGAHRDFGDSPRACRPPFSSTTSCTTLTWPRA